jgi:hypothetical protein
VTKDDLQARVHDWMSRDAGEARRLVAALNAEGIEGDSARQHDAPCPVQVDGDRAAGLLAELGIGHIDETIP